MGIFIGLFLCIRMCRGGGHCWRCGRRRRRNCASHRPTGEAGLLTGVCIALKGYPENNTRIDIPNVMCYGISADTCTNINGGAVTLYNENDSSCKMDDGSVFKWLDENAK